MFLNITAWVVEERNKLCRQKKPVGYAIRNPNMENGQGNEGKEVISDGKEKSERGPKKA